MHMRITRHLIVAGLAALLVMPAIPAGVALADGTLDPTSTVLALAIGSTSPSQYGQLVTFTATVADVGTLGGTPTGTVTLWDGAPGPGGTSLDTKPLAAGVATLSTSTLSVAGSPHVIVAVYNGDGLNYDASGPSNELDQTITQANQTITFDPSDTTFSNAPVTLSASASSGLAVSFASSTMGVCTVAGTAVTLVSVGTCTITASQLGDSNWNAATPVTQSFDITQANQTITFGPAPTGINVGATGRVVHATASSNLAVTYGSQPAAICTVNSSTGALTLLSVGSCTITADQTGDSNWNAAPRQVLSLAVAPPFTVPTLTVTPDPQTRPFGTANPAFTYVVSGLINGQTLTTGQVSGTPACTTTATLFSAAGTYPITCSIGTLTSPFYSFAFVTGTLTITHGASSVTLSTTTTVFETSTPVTWTAAVEPGVSGATPVGSLVFTIDGVVRPAVPLDANGRGAITVTWPTAGRKSVSVSYAGDTSFAASGTASASPMVVANTARATGLGVTETTFYPLVDGWRDTVTARGTRLEPLSVSISVKNANGSIVRTFTARTASGPYTWAWNGRTSSGSVLPAGVYTITQRLADPYGSHPSAVKVAKVTLSLRKLTWSTVTVTARPGPRCFQFTSGDGVGAYSCGSSGALGLTGGAGHWPGVGYQFQLPSADAYRSIRVEVLGAFSGARPTVGFHVWSLGSTWGQLYRPGWGRTAISPTARAWSGVTFTNPGAYISGRSVRVYVDGGGRLGRAFGFSITGIRIVVSVGKLQ